MQNPFEEILAEIVVLRKTVEQQIAIVEASKQYKEPYIPVDRIIGTYCSKTSLYQYVKDGTVKLYKLGGLSFVKTDEFFSSHVFIPVQMEH